MQAASYNNPNNNDRAGIRTYAGVQPVIITQVEKNRRTREKKKAKERWKWLTIFPYMDGMDDLPDDELKMVGYILKRNHYHKNGVRAYYVDILADDLKNKFGLAYVSILASLEAKGYIQINKRFKKNAFSRGYRIHPRFKDAKEMVRQIDLPKKTRHLDRSIVTTATQKALLENKRKLVVRDNPLAIESTPVRAALGIEGLQKISAGILNQAKYTDSGRLDDEYIRLPKEYRQTLGVNLKGHTYKLIPLDFTAFHPFLLHTEYNRIPNSGEERKRYLAAIAQDIRLFLKPANMSKETAKAQLNAFIAGGYKDGKKRMVNNRISREFEKHFPLMFNHIRNTPNMAVTLQNLEASIIIGEVAATCIEQDIWIATEHDGCSTIKDHVETVRQLMIDTCVKRFGVSCAVKVSINLD